MGERQHMRRIVGALAALGIALGIALGVTVADPAPAPAEAGLTCAMHISCGSVYHKNAGLDRALVVKCSDRSTVAKVTKGHSSRDYAGCRDANYVQVPDRTELWCYGLNLIGPDWFKVRDATGWYFLPDLSHQSCTLRSD